MENGDYHIPMTAFQSELNNDSSSCSSYSEKQPWEHGAMDLIWGFKI